jgi:RHS repeat-associated protein
VPPIPRTLTGAAGRTSRSSAPSVSLPKGGGSIRGIDEKYGTAPATGTASLQIPIPATPGRGEILPGLSLEYDSGAGNGIFGLGWSAPLPMVSRRTDRSVPRYDDAADTYLFSGVELVAALDESGGPGTKPAPVTRPDDGHTVTRYRPRVEGAFTRIERWSNDQSGEVHWRTISRTNVTSILGRSAECRVADPDDPHRVHTWLIEERRDEFGNVVAFEYAREDLTGVDGPPASELGRVGRLQAHRHPKRIRYGNRVMDTPGDWMFELVFDYGDHDRDAPGVDPDRPWPRRRDPFSTCRPGFEVRTQRLCRRILMFHRLEPLGPAPRLVRSLDLEYSEGPIASLLVGIAHTGYTRAGEQAPYVADSMPQSRFTYTSADLDLTVRTLPEDSLEGLPTGLTGEYGLVDLDGEGLPGILAEEDGTWRYKRNLGEGKFAPPVAVGSAPTISQPAAGSHQLIDLTGEGKPDVVVLGPAVAGYAAREDDRWDALRPFASVPSIDWADPSLRMVDLTGDGHADVLRDADDGMLWHESLGRSGFGEAVAVRRALDEDRGPLLLLADAERAVFLADMNGDGLPDLVRIRNGEVAYWPSLGHGRFGAKVTMDAAPRFTGDEQFDPTRIRLADVDGSGVADVLYWDGAGVSMWANEAGNGLAAEARVVEFPASAAPPADVTVADLAGNGTASVVWSSPFPAEAEPLRYVQPLRGKPYLLETADNAAGRTRTHVYAPSTRFYLADRAAGRPWHSNLPFPVQVLERVETHDAVAGTRDVVRFAYHHGRFDPVEREVCGFGCVEQWDSESVEGPDPAAVADDLAAPPVHTITWFHTGHSPDTTLARQFETEYYAGDPQAVMLPDAFLEGNWSPEDVRQAARAMKGNILHQETYADDGVDDASRERAKHPYATSERSYMLRLHQGAHDGHAAVVSCHPRESLDYHYEREPADPRISHKLTLVVDEQGLERRSLEVGYPRRPASAGAAAHENEQTVTRAILLEHDLEHVEEPHAHRPGVPIEARGYEVLGLDGSGGPIPFVDLASAVDGAPALAFDDAPAGGIARRLIERMRTIYCADDGATALPLGQTTSRALVHHELAEAFTETQAQGVFGDDVDAAVLEGEGGYVHADGAWWNSSGSHAYDPQRFFLTIRYTDAFGHDQTVEYDPRNLVVTRVTDPLGNAIAAEYDWSRLLPILITDPNGSRTAARLDAHGRAVAVALMGKEGEQDAAKRGDTLDDPSERFTYRPREWVDHGRPVAVDTASREEHGGDRWLETTTYQDGSGRVIQTKTRAEPGPAPVRDAGGKLRRSPQGALAVEPVAERWVGSGRTVYDSKGRAVKQFEPFFSSTRAYEEEADLVEWGVSSVTRYDPLGRQTRVDLPDGTHMRDDIGAWESSHWDQSDTVAGSRWAAERAALPASDPRHRAGALSAAHAGTPLHTLSDSLGRTFLTIADNGAGHTIEHRVSLNGRGDPVEATDGNGNRAMTVDWGMLSQQLRIRRMDGGERRLLVNTADNPVRQWDEGGRVRRHAYDELQRRTHTYVSEGGVETLAERAVFGDDHPQAAALNLRGRVHLTFDASGMTEHREYDFKGNLLRSARRLARSYRDDTDWAPLAAKTGAAAVAAADPLLEADVYESAAEYDARNRAVRTTQPDGSERRATYNEGALLERVEVRLRGAADWTTFLSELDHDAKAQLLSVRHGNGALTSYTYDPETLRIARLRTARGQTVLQDLDYTYDAVGNVVEVRDSTQQTRFFANAVVEPHLRYEHDAVHRLVSAEGRERARGQVDHTLPAPYPLPHPNDGSAVQRYTERYEYDDAGNITSVAHSAPTAAWTRRHVHGPGSNRLTATSAPGDAAGDASARYAYDAHGNVTAMPHLPSLAWDHRDRLREVDLGGGGRAYYVYDASGARVRKVIERGGAPSEERIAIGAFELYRRHGAGGAVAFARETLLIGDARTSAIAETEVVRDGNAVANPVPRIRFQHGDHLGSVTLETDESGALISYEEYYAFGATAYFSARAGLEASPKRFRYIGRERDEETGLQLHGARYYAPWLGRFISFDPVELMTAAASGDPNGYAYASNNPVVLSDPNGGLSWGQVIGFGVAVGLGIAVTILTGGIAGPIVAGAIGGMVGAVAGEVTEQVIDHGKIVDPGRIAVAGVTGLALGGLLAAVAPAVGGALSRGIGRALATEGGQAAIAAFRDITERAVQRPVGAALAAAGRAVAGAVRAGVVALEEAGEGAGTRMGGRFAENAARQAEARAAQTAAADAALQNAPERGVRGAMRGTADGASADATTNSGRYNGQRAPQNRTPIETPNGPVAPPETPPAPLDPRPVANVRGGPPYPREHCAEIKLFGRTLNNTTPSSTGTVAFGQGTQNGPVLMCPSCTANSWILRGARPNMNFRFGAPGSDIPFSGAGGAAVPQLVLPSDDPNRAINPAGRMIELTIPLD